MFLINARLKLARGIEPCVSDCVPFDPSRLIIFKHVSAVKNFRWSRHATTHHLRHVTHKTRDSENEKFFRELFSSFLTSHSPTHKEPSKRFWQTDAQKHQRGGKTFSLKRRWKSFLLACSRSAPSKVEANFHVNKQQFFIVVEVAIMQWCAFIWVIRLLFGWKKEMKFMLSHQRRKKRFGRAKNCTLFDKCYVCSSFISSVKCSQYDLCESDVTSGQ